MTTATLTGIQRAALVLLQLDQRHAAEVMKHFTDAEVEEIAAEIVRMRSVEAEVADGALSDVYDAIVTRRFSGGRTVAAGLLEATFGTDRAAGVMSRLGSTIAGQQFEFLETVEDMHVVRLLDGEHPQTVAVVLAHLRPERSSSLLTALPPEMRAEIARRIATTDSPAPEAVSIVAETLRQRSGAVLATRDAADAIGGVPPLVTILNHSDKSTESAVLEGLDALDPELAEQVRAQLLTFADVVLVDDLDMQRVLRAIDPVDLAVALKGASPEVTEKVRSNISSRNVEILDEEMARPVRLRSSQVEDARAEVVRTMRELEAAGDLVVVRGGEDGYVD